MADSAQPPKDAKTVRFHYLKSPAFHTVPADGAIGGLTPNGDFHLALYVERSPIPTITEHQVGEYGPAEEILEKRVVRDGIVRELVVDVVFNYRAAISFREWFDNNIKQFEQLLRQRTEEMRKRTDEMQQKQPGGK